MPARHARTCRAANLASSTAQLKRYQVLIGSNAISKQDFDDAEAAQHLGAAEGLPEPAHLDRAHPRSPAVRTLRGGLRGGLFAPPAPGPIRAAKD